MRFTINICTYNSDRYLFFCLNSVAKQVFNDYEVIVVDGYSVDKTINIINEFKKKIPIRIYQQKPSGISSAMNYAIAKAKADFIMHLHSDDMLYDKSVLKDVNEFLAKNRHLDWIFGKINIIDENGLSQGTYPNRKLFQVSWPYLLRFINFIPHQSVFIKKTVFEKYGNFDESVSSAMDTDLWIRIGASTKWKYINRVISNYRIHSYSQSSSIKNQLINEENHEKVQKRYCNSLEFALAKIINKIIWNIGKSKNLR